MTTKDFPKLLKEAFTVWDDAKASMLGAALSYYTVFSLAPLLVIVLAVAGMMFGEKAASGQLAAELEQTAGPSFALAVQEMVQHASRPGRSPTALVIGVVVLLIGASGVFNELQRSLNIIWKVEPKPGRGIKGIIHDRVLSFSMILVVCFLLLVSLVVTAVLAAFTKFWTPSTLPGGAYLWQAINLLIGLAVLIALFGLIYKYLPDARVGWRDVWVGAAVTAVLFTLGRYLLGLYLGHAGVTAGFGAAGSLALILVWVYYSAQIFLYGAAFTRVYAEHHGRPIAPADNAVHAATADPTKPVVAPPPPAARRTSRRVDSPV